MRGLKVSLRDGSLEGVECEELRLELVGDEGLKVVWGKGGGVLMEGMMKVEVVSGEEKMGDVMGELKKGGGVVEGMEEVVLSVDGKMVGCEGERKKLEV